MLLFQFIFLLPVLVFGGTITRKVDGVECTAQSGFDAITCAVKLTNLQKHLDEWESSNNIDAVKESCKKVEPCLTYLRCTDEKNIDLTTLLSNHCKSMIFLSENFADCYEKLEKRNSTCFDQWDIFPGLDETGDVRVVTDKEKYCKNFFGSENCMKKEVVEQCDEGMWKDLKKTLISNEKNCDFKNL